jgi:phosphoserine phosphatase RsbU/P
MIENNPFAKEEEMLRGELLQFAGGVARSSGVAMAIASESGTHWIVDDRQCSCSQTTVSPVACPAIPGQTKRHIEVIETPWIGRKKRKVILCCSPSSGTVVPALLQLVQLAAKKSELENEATSLRKELSASWESLDTLYQVSSQLRLSQSPQELLELIVGRAATIKEGLRAILWLTREKAFTPVVCLNVQRPPVRNAPQGLAARAISQRAGFVLNGRSRVAAAAGLEPELQGASAVVVAPVAVKEELFGAMVVWVVAGEEEFDSPVTRLIEALAMQAALVLENDRLQREFINGERIRKELEISSSIQQMLLSGRPLHKLDGTRLAAVTLPSEKVDGDFYDFIEHGTGCFDVIIGDVMGKGVPAALVAAAIKSSLLHAFIRCSALDSGVLPEPREIVTSTHAEMAKQLMDLESFATLCYGRFHLHSRRVDLVSCGHTSTIHVRSATGESRELNGENVPLGILESEIYEQKSVDFEPNDLFFFYSDGVTETRNEQGECFGEERLAECLRTNRESEPEDVISAVRQQLLEYSGTERLSDDLTCIAVAIGTGIGSVQALRRQAEFRRDLSELAAIRMWVRGACKRLTRLRVDEESLTRLELAATEAASNIILHAGLERSDSFIHLSAEELEDGILLDFSYHGPAFDPKGVPPPAFDGSRDRGFGVFIISQAADEVSYLRDLNGINHVKLLKNLPQRREEGEQMFLQVENIDDVAVVVLLADSLDAGSAKEFKREVSPVVSANSKVALDMSHLNFVDSSGLGAILSCLRQLNASGGDLKLFGVTKPVRSLLELVRLHRIFEICNARDETLAAFRHAPAH